MPPKSKPSGKFKGTKNKRQGEIYAYFRQQLDQTKKSQSEFFTAHLSLDPQTMKGLKKLSRQYPQHDFYAEFKRNPNNVVYRLNKAGRNCLLKQTNQAYREEIAEQNSQVRYWQERAGLTQVQSSKLIKKGQQAKLFFPEKGEHKQFFARKKEFKKILTEILSSKGSIKERQRVLDLSQLLYEKSPWRIRDRFLIPTNQPARRFNVGEQFDKYYKNNPYVPTRQHYLLAFIKLSRRTTPYGEPVPDSEIELDRYGWPRLKEDQVIAIDNKKPGRRWSVYKNRPPLEEIVKKEVYEPAHSSYIEEYGTELEKQTWRLKRDKALCWIEAALGQSCSANQGTSSWWCLDCIRFGEYHPPVLPKHCPWLYTYKNWLCGTKEHSDANKQWHFSVEGEKIRDAIKGGDWGSCHIGAFDGKKMKKQKRK